MTRWTVLIALTILFVTLKQTTSEINSIKLKVVNYAGLPIQIFWINTFSPQRELVAQTSKPLRNNTDASINTYETHQFSIRWLKHIPGVDFNFTMGGVDETRVVRFDEISNSFVVERQDARTEIIAAIQEKTKGCSAIEGMTKKELKQCLVQNLGEEVHRLLNTTHLVSNYHHKMVDRIQQYSCQEGLMNYSKPAETVRYNFLGRSYRNDIFVTDEGSHVWGIYDFLSSDDCDTLFPQKPKSSFVDSIVDSLGTFKFLSHEKKNVSQSFYNVQSDFRNDKLWPTLDRLLHAFNHYGDLNVQPSNRIRISSETYKVGASEGDVMLRPSTLHGGSVLLFCQTPVAGGAIVFPYADVQIKPQKYMAIFSSSKDSIGKQLTRLKKCPVIEGQSQIVEIAWQ